MRICKVSIVLCVHNGERFLRETIDSVLGQTFRDFEFIIWNDGSTDSTEDIIKSYKDSRIRYFSQAFGCFGTVSYHANRAAIGKYIAKIDADDVCMPDRIQREFDFLEAHPDYCLVSSAVVFIDEQSREMGRNFPYTLPRHLSRHPWVAHPGAMYRRDVYMRTCGYQSVRWAEDKLLWSKMLRFGKFANIRQPLLKYRLVSTSITNSRDANGEAARKLDELIVKMCLDETIDPEDVAMCNKLYAQTCGEKTGEKVPPVHIKTWEEKLYDIMTLLVGKSLAEMAVYSVQNMHGYWKLRHRHDYSKPQAK